MENLFSGSMPFGQHESILDTMLEGVQIINYNWRYVYVNQAVLNYSLYTRDELIGFLMTDKYPGIEKTHLFSVLKRCMNERTSAQIENEFVFPNEAKSYFQLSIQPCKEGILVLSIDISQYISAKKNLQSAHEKLLRQLENTPLGFIEWDGQMKVKSISNRTEEILGWTLDELQQNKITISSLVVNEDQKMIAYRTRELINGDTDRNKLVIKNKTKDSRIVWCEWFNSIIRNENGSVIIISLINDVTEKKNSEQQREFEQNNLNALINSTQDLMWSINKDFKLITFNEPFKNLIKKVTGQKIDKGYDVLTFDVPVERLHRMEGFYKRAFDGEIFTEIQYVDEPVETWNEVSFFPIKKDNKVVGTACHSRDISKRKQAEQQLKNSEAFNRGVIDSLNAHVAVVDNDGVIITINEAWKKFAEENGNTTLQQTGPGINYFHVCKKAASEGDDMARQMLHGIYDVIDKKTNIFHLEYNCYPKNKEMWFSMRVMRFENDGGMVVISHQDITERKIVEIEHKRMFNALLQRNKDLEQFSYIVSHNLRVPVANLIGASDIINNIELSDEDRQTLINDLEKSARRLDVVLKDLNHILSIRDVIKNAKEKINFESLVSELTEDINYLIEENNIVIKKDFSQAPEIYSLKSYIYSIFFNLITNSIKFRKQYTQAIIEISSAIVNNKIILTFSDNGIGINLNEKGNDIFGLYKRFHLAVEGRGMGLFLVKTQVEALQGTISLESEEDKGSKFIITLPANA